MEDSSYCEAGGQRTVVTVRQSGQRTVVTVRQSKWRTVVTVRLVDRGQ